MFQQKKFLYTIYTAVLSTLLCGSVNATESETENLKRQNKATVTPKGGSEYVVHLPGVETSVAIASATLVKLLPGINLTNLTSNSDATAAVLAVPGGIDKIRAYVAEQLD